MSEGKEVEKLLNENKLLKRILGLARRAHRNKTYVNLTLTGCKKLEKCLVDMGKRKSSKKMIKDTIFIFISAAVLWRKHLINFEHFALLSKVVYSSISLIIHNLTNLNKLCSKIIKPNGEKSNLNKTKHHTTLKNPLDIFLNSVE